MSIKRKISYRDKSDHPRKKIKREGRSLFSKHAQNALLHENTSQKKTCSFFFENEGLLMESP